MFPQKILNVYVTKPENKDALLTSNEFVKLNTGFFAKICLDKEQYDAYYKVLERVLLRLLPSNNSNVISDLLLLCRERNYFMRCMLDKKEKKLSLHFKPATMDALEESGFYYFTT